MKVFWEARKSWTCRSIFCLTIGICLFGAPTASGGLLSISAGTVTGVNGSGAVYENNASGTIQWTIANISGSFLYVDFTTVYGDFQGNQGSSLWFNTSTGLGDPKDIIYEFSSQNNKPTVGPPTFSAPTGGYLISFGNNIYGLGVGASISSIIITMPWVTSGPDYDNNQNTTWVWPLFNYSTSLNGAGTALVNPVQFNGQTWNGLTLTSPSVTVIDPPAPSPEPGTMALMLLSFGLGTVRQFRGWKCRKGVRV